MSVVLGVDVGGSTTKIVGFASDQSMVGSLQVKASDQITSMYGAIGHFLRAHKLYLEDLSDIVLTGVGASLIDGNVFDIPTHKVDEFRAIGHGGLKLSGLNQALVVSIGTGTAYVRAGEGSFKHLGGSGVGGGTLTGLASKLINESDISVITAMAEIGKLENVDLSIQDISQGVIPSLPPNATASNFGRVKNIATDADFASGLINMIFQTVGMLAVFATLNDPVKDIVMTGSLTILPQAKYVFGILSSMQNVNIMIPDNAVFATAIGATVPYVKG